MLRDHQKNNDGNINCCISYHFLEIIISLKEQVDRHTEALDESLKLEEENSLLNKQVSNLHLSVSIFFSSIKLICKLEQGTAEYSKLKKGLDDLQHQLYKQKKSLLQVILIEFHAKSINRKIKNYKMI